MLADRCAAPGDNTQALTAVKARWLMHQLQSLGFRDWQCAPAVLAHGSDLHASLAFLLEEAIATPEQAKEFMARPHAPPDIDIAEELAMVAAAQVGGPFPASSPVRDFRGLFSLHSWPWWLVRMSAHARMLSPQSPVKSRRGARRTSQDAKCAPPGLL